MILAQMAVPLAVVVGALFAGWFAGDVLSNPRADDPDGTLALARRAVSEHVARLLLAVGMAAIVALPAAAALLWLAFDDAEPVAYVSGAMVAGLVAAFFAITVGPAMAGQVTLRAVRAMSRGPSITFGMLLWGSATPALITALLAAGIPAGLFGAYTNLLDQSTGKAALAIAGFPLGAAIGMVIAVAGGGAFAGRLQSESPAAPHAEAAGWTLHDSATAGAMHVAAATVTTLAIGAGGALFITTDDAEWAVLGPSIVALGLLASVIGFVSLAAWVRLLPRPGAAVFAGATVAGVLSLLMAAAAVPVLVDDGEGWFAAIVASGVAGGWLLFAVVPAGERWPSVVAAVVALAVLAAGAGLGAVANINGVHGSISGLLGMAVAAAGLVAPWPYVTMLAWLRGCARTVGALARSADPFEEDAGAAREAIARAGEASGRRAATFVVAAAMVCAALGVSIVLVAARDALVVVAVDDRERYVEAAQAMHLVPHGPEFASAAAVELGRFVEGLEGGGFNDEQLGWLLAANDDQARAFARLRRDDPDLDGDLVARLSGSPVSLPHLVPLNLARGPGLAGAALGVLGVATAAAPLVRIRRDTAPDNDAIARAGRAGLAATVLPAIAILAGTAVVGLPFRSLGDAAAGWEAAAGFAAGTALASLGAAFVAGEPERPAWMAIAAAAPLATIVLMPAFIV